MTDRDRKLLLAVVGIVLLAGFWLLVLGPKRGALSTAEADKSAAQAELDKAKASAANGQTEKKNFHVSYAKLVRLGKAIPSTPSEATLVVQLHDVAEESNVEMMSLAVQEGGTADNVPGGQPGAPAEATTCDNAPSGQTGAAGTETAPGATPSTGVGRTIDKARDAGETGSADANRAGDSNADTGATCADAPSAADLAAAAAGLKIDTFELTFHGDFYDLHKFFKKMYDLVERRNEKNLRIRGRLLQISKIDMTVKGFPNLEAQVTMTGYRLPATVSPTAGATPSGPAPAAGDPASSNTPTAGAMGVR